MRIRGTCSPKNAIAKTRYLGGRVGGLPAPANFSYTLQPGYGSTAAASRPNDLKSVHEAQDGRAPDFHNSSKYLGKGAFVFQTRISDL